MGGFLLIKKNRNIPVEEIERQNHNSIGVFKKKGLKLRKKIVREKFALWVFHKYSLETENIIEFENGDCVVATGTSIYNGKTGARALKAFYEAFSNERDFHADLYGHYCILIFHSGKLFVFTDYAGLYKVYCNRTKSGLSNSFLAIAKTLQRKNVSQQELYEYVFHEAFYGDKTLFKEIELLDSKSLWQISPDLSNTPQQIAVDDFRNTVSFDEAVTVVSRSLINYFELLKSAFDNKVASSLSGGYDTRLMLALTRKAGISPYFFVYGDRDSIDVDIAKAIARGEKFEIDHIDKSKYPKVAKESFYEMIEKNFFLFDGFGAMGIFDNGSDIDTRIDRATRAHLHLNAGGGEIYRRTWQFSDKRKIHIENFLKNKYGHLYMLNDFIDYSMCGDLFDKRVYLSNFTEKIKAILDIDKDWMTKQELEVLYSILSVKYWLGMNNSIDNQFSYSLTPFAESRFVYQSLNIPSQYKSFGQFEAALIRKVDPDLAKYPSQYGFNFYDQISWQTKMKDTIREMLKSSFIFRPMMPLIRNTIQARRCQMPYYLQKDYVQEIFNNRDLNVSQYIDVTKIKDPAILSRVLTLEFMIEDNF